MVRSEGGQGRGIVTVSLEVGGVVFESSRGFKVELLFLGGCFSKLSINELGGKNSTW